MRHFFNTEVAKMFHDTNVATLFENICYWIAHNKANNKNLHEIEINGETHKRTFTYNSLAAFCQLFPYWSKKQIENYLTKLKESNLIVKSAFNVKGFDRTAWYCLVDESYLCEFLETPAPNEKKQKTATPQDPDSVPVNNNIDGKNEDPPNGKINTPEIGNGYHQNGKCISQNGEMDTPETGNGFRQNGKCTSPNGEMDFSKKGNALPQTGTAFPRLGIPIPDENSFKTQFKKTATVTATYTYELQKIFEKIDGTLVFDMQFYPAAAAFLLQNGEEDFTGYCVWLYEQVIKRKPDSVRNYYYKVFLFQDNFLSYKGSEKEKEKKSSKQKITCPVCGSETDIYGSSCPQCDFNLGYFKQPEEIEKHKRLFNLAADRKAAYENELQELAKSCDSPLSPFFITAYKDLQRKYGILG